MVNGDPCALANDSNYMQGDTRSIAKFIMVQDCGWGLLWVIVNSHIH